MKVNIGGAWKPVVSAKMNIGGTLKRMSLVRHNVAGTFKAGASFYVALTAPESPASVSGLSYSSPVTTNAATVTPAGGYAPYTYAWTRLSGVGSAVSPTSAITTFTAAVGFGLVRDGTFRCTVTDSHGATATADVSAAFENQGP